MFRRKIKRSMWMQGVIDAESGLIPTIPYDTLSGDWQDWRKGVADYDSNKIFRLKGENNAN